MPNKKKNYQFKTTHVDVTWIQNEFFELILCMNRPTKPGQTPLLQHA
jgi:hypothetical protein